MSFSAPVGATAATAPRTGTGTTAGLEWAAGEEEEGEELGSGAVELRELAKWNLLSGSEQPNIPNRRLPDDFDV
jgi:hypothetical protein